METGPWTPTPLPPTGGLLYPWRAVSPASFPAPSQTARNSCSAIFLLPFCPLANHSVDTRVGTCKDQGLAGQGREKDCLPLGVPGMSSRPRAAKEGPHCPLLGPHVHCSWHEGDWAGSRGGPPW